MDDERTVAKSLNFVLFDHVVFFLDGEKRNTWNLHSFIDTFKLDREDNNLCRVLPSIHKAIRILQKSSRRRAVDGS